MSAEVPWAWRLAYQRAFHREHGDWPTTKQTEAAYRATLGAAEPTGDES